MKAVSLPATLIGFFLGFAFGVGCALAVMYSLYAGGYRAAVHDATLSIAPDRLARARAKELGTQSAQAVFKDRPAVTKD